MCLYLKITILHALFYRAFNFNSLKTVPNALSGSALFPSLSQCVYGIVTYMARLILSMSQVRYTPQLQMMVAYALQL